MSYSIWRKAYMDIIVNSYFDKFLKEQKISGGKTDTNFEKFINYICLATRNINNFSLVSTCVGAGGDAGIDGIAIAINNRYVLDISDIAELIDKGMELNVELFFIQAKTSETFECKEISNFADGVLDLFKAEYEIKKIMNDKVKAKYNMIRKLIDDYDFIKSIKCTLLYVTPGKFIEDDNIASTKQKIMDNLKALDIFKEDNISIEIKDKAFIRKQYESTKVQNFATFELSQKIEIPFMQGVDEAYFAIMPIKEYLKIIVDDAGRIRSGIFELNARDFAGIEDNRVNQDIVTTINSKDKSYFGLLNNGITIVGKSLSKMQGKYTIKNFYVVNGCQTTNVLSENLSNISDDMWISVKFVITQDDDIIKNIVKATNSQTEVEEIQLLSMNEYQQELESFFSTYDTYTKLFYERREGQYRDNPEALPVKIINPELQMKCFSSIFLQIPHIASRFSGKLQDENKQIFLTNDNPIMYYTAALLNYHVELAFLNDKIKQVYYKFRYHIQMLIASDVWKKEKQPQRNSKKMQTYCEILISQIEDETTFETLLQNAKKCIDKVVANINDTEITKSITIINNLLMYLRIGWTDKEVKAVKHFLAIVEDYITPFNNMGIDGDLRYNFNKNLTYLQKITMDNPTVFAILKKDFFEDILWEIDEDDRYSRKANSIKISEEYSRICKQLNIKLKESKKYTSKK